MTVVVDPDFLRGALPQAALWGRIALSVGFAGLSGSLVLSVIHVRDQRSLRGGEKNPRQYRPPTLGPLNQSLGEFFADPVQNAPFSPDAAAEYVLGRLESQRDVSQSAVRYLSYAPLLFGLMGTIFSLRALLVVSGNTLQQIQPQLAGVFAGTLAGIIGSLIGAVGSLIFDYVSQSTINRAQDFIHRNILPTLPERRIAIRIEDAVLTLIAERTQVVADNFRSALQPVAAEMAQVASHCSKAAESATEAFAEATRALREAGDLGTASRNFKSGAHMIDSSAEQLSDATRQTAEVILRLGELRSSFEEVVVRLMAASSAVAEASNHLSTDLSTHIKELNIKGGKVHDSVGALNCAMDTLAAELQKGASDHSAHLEVIKNHAEVSGRALASITDAGKQASAAFKGLPGTVEEIGQSLERAVHQSVSTEIERLMKHVSSVLENTVVLLAKAGESLSAVAREVNRNDHNGSISIPIELTTTLRDAASAFRSASEESRRFTERIELTLTSRDKVPKKNDGFFRRLWR